jgi:hypothetical protein
MKDRYSNRLLNGALIKTEIKDNVKKRKKKEKIVFEGG